MVSPLEEQLLNDYRNSFKIRLRRAWSELLLRYEWTWFFTLTFALDVYPEESLKKLKVWASKLNQILYGKRWYQKGLGVYWVAAFERTKAGRLHIHGVMIGAEKLDNFYCAELWNNLDVNDKGLPKKTGIARIYPIDNIAGTCNYVTKYVTKEGDIEFSDTLKAVESDLLSGLVQP
jgi:hypothetical protein